jgi:hypothetical protein
MSGFVLILREIVNLVTTQPFLTLPRIAGSCTPRISKLHIAPESVSVDAGENEDVHSGTAKAVMS